MLLERRCVDCQLYDQLQMRQRLPFGYGMVLRRRQIRVLLP